MATPCLLWFQSKPSLGPSIGLGGGGAGLSLGFWRDCFEVLKASMRSWERVEDVRTERRWRDLGREELLLDDEGFILGCVGCGVVVGSCGGGFGRMEVY